MFTLLLISVLSHFAPEKSSQELSLGLLVFPPHVEINAQTGECEGFAVETVKTLLSEHPIRVTCAPPARIFRFIQRGEIDMTINIKSTQAIKPYVDFIDPPYTKLQLKLFGHNHVTGPGTIAAIRGFDYHGERTRLKQLGYIFVDLPDALTAVSMFTRSRTDYLLSYAAPTVPMVIYFPADFTSQTVLTVPTHLAVSKLSPNNALIIKTLQSRLEGEKLGYLKDILNSRSTTPR